MPQKNTWWFELHTSTVSMSAFHQWPSVYHAFQTCIANFNPIQHTLIDKIQHFLWRKKTSMLINVMHCYHYRKSLQPHPLIIENISNLNRKKTYYIDRWNLFKTNGWTWYIKQAYMLCIFCITRIKKNYILLINKTRTAFLTYHDFLSFFIIFFLSYFLSMISYKRITFS